MMASAFDSVGDKGRVRTKIREKKKKANRFLLPVFANKSHQSVYGFSGIHQVKN